MSKISQQILEYLQTIPKGKVSTYKNIAEKFGVHPRVVASAMRHNKHPDIYPCSKKSKNSKPMGLLLRMARLVKILLFKIFFPIFHILSVR